MARWLVLAMLVLFAAPVAVALIVVAVWLLIPSAHGRGRHLRPLIALALGGFGGLAAWMLLSGRSPLDDGVVAQLMLAKALVSGSGMPAQHLIRHWLARVGPLAIGLGPALALAAAWKISRRPADDHIPKRVAELASGGAEAGI